MLAHLREEATYSRGVWQGHWGRAYRFFKLMIKQGSYLAQQFAKIKDWDELQAFINANLDRIYAHPLSIYDNEQFVFKRVGRIEFLHGVAENADNSHLWDVGNIDDDEYKGRAWVMSAILYQAPGGKRFKMQPFKDAMAAFGIYIRGEDYHPADEVNGKQIDTHWKCEMVFLRKQWPNLPKPVAPPSEDDEDEVSREDDDYLFEADDDALFDNDEDETAARDRERLESYKKMFF